MELRLHREGEQPVFLHAARLCHRPELAVRCDALQQLGGTVNAGPGEPFGVSRTGLGEVIEPRHGRTPLEPLNAFRGRRLRQAAEAAVVTTPGPGPGSRQDALAP